MTTILPEPVPNGAMPQGRRVLVVEDDRVTAGLLRYILAEEGWEVDVVHTGSDALRAIRSTAAGIGIVVTAAGAVAVGGDYSWAPWKAVEWEGPSEGRSGSLRGCRASRPVVRSTRCGPA